MTLPTSHTTTFGQTTRDGRDIGRASALLGFEARVGLVDDIDPALAAHELAVAVTRLERLERASDLHRTTRDLSRARTKASGGFTRARGYTERPSQSQCGVARSPSLAIEPPRDAL